MTDKTSAVAADGTAPADGAASASGGASAGDLAGEDLAGNGLSPDETAEHYHIEHYCWPQHGTERRSAAAGPTLYYRDSVVEVHKVVVGPIDNNVFVVRCRQTGDAVLVDAANEHEKLLELCGALGVRHVIETHGHWDHIAAVPEIREAGYDVHVAEPDAYMLDNAYDQFIDDESVIEVGRLPLHTLLTPGHTPGSVCFQVEGTPLLFSGDTLFPGGPGATNFEGGHFPTIIESLDKLIFSRFAPETVVLPGHGDDTTIGRESPHLQEWADRGW